MDVEAEVWGDAFVQTQQLNSMVIESSPEVEEQERATAPQGWHELHEFAPVG